MEKNRTINNHYVPQFYMKYWSNNNKHVYVYKTIVPNEYFPYWKIKSIKNTAVGKDIYTFYDGQIENDDFEKLTSEIESKSKIIMDNIIKKGKLDTIEIEYLIKFIILSKYRTPKAFKVITEFLVNHTEKLFNELTKKLLNYDNQILKNPKNKKKINTKKIVDNQFFDAKSAMIPLSIKANTEDSLLDLEAAAGREAIINIIERLLTEGIELETLKRQKWEIIKALPGIYFPTSDNPVVSLMVKDELIYLNEVFGLKDSIIFMPLTPNYIIITYIDNKIDVKRLNKSKQRQREIVKYICTNAYSEIYNISEYDKVRELQPRVVSEEIFKSIKNSMESYNENNKKLIDDIYGKGK